MSRSRIPTGQSERPQRPAFAAWMEQGNDITQQFLSFGGRPGLIALSGGLPAPELYPVPEVEDATRRALDRHGSAALGYGAIEGMTELREAVARRYSRGGLALTADNVIITTGSIQALELIGTVLLDSGDVVLAEYPTYLGALDAWLPRQPRYGQLPLEGAWPRAKFAYVVPNFSNPTGAVMTRALREALARRALASGAWLVEDDPYGELRYSGAAETSLIELAAAAAPGPYGGPVVHLGTVSKTIAPGLRVGWAIGAPEMIRAIARAKQGSDLSTSTFCQAVALALIEADADRRHAPVLLAAYRERRDALCGALQEHLSDLFTWTVPDGGMFVWLTARRPDLDTDALLEAALRENVAFVPGSVFNPEGRVSASLRLNFTANPPDMLREGVRRLGRAVRAFMSHRTAAE